MNVGVGPTHGTHVFIHSTLCYFKPMLFLHESLCGYFISQRCLQPATPGLLFSSFPGPSMRWNGWRKCQLCFRALELNATLQNQNHKQKGVKIQGAKNSRGKWWWIRNTLSCGGAPSQAPTFTSIEVSSAWLLLSVPCPPDLSSSYSLNGFFGGFSGSCHSLLLVVVLLLDDKSLRQESQVSLLYFAIGHLCPTLLPHCDF